MGYLVCSAPQAREHEPLLLVQDRYSGPQELGRALVSLKEAKQTVQVGKYVQTVKRCLSS